MGAETGREIADLNASKIPLTLRIGVTGHRKLEKETVIKNSVRNELQELDEMLSRAFPNSPHTFISISPLAEGADRLVVHEIIQMNKTADENYAPFLEVLFPMPEHLYVQDFTAPGSIEDFNYLKGKARIVKALEYNGNRDEAFENVGHNVVHSCDILFVIWNGKKAIGRGGTAEIYEYAKKVGRSYIWINSETGIVQEKWIEHEHLITPLKMLDLYNNETLKPKEITKLADSRYDSFIVQAPEDNLTPDSIISLRNDLMPKYARTSLLSKFYQKWYFRAGAMIYVLSALAVATVTLQTLFYTEHAEILWLEVLYMLGILVTVYASNRIGLHRRWIDYRFLAERMRTAIFFSVAGIGHEPLGYLPYVRKSQQTDYWIVKAFSWVWSTLPQKSQKSSINFDRLKAYMKTFWVEDQLNFYLEKSHEHHRIHEKYELMGLGLFILTLIAAFLHASKLEHILLGHEVISPNVLASFGIILPAMAASLAGIASNKEFLKNSARYEQMVSPLKGICQQMDYVKSMDQLTELLEQANDLILRENQDWRVSFLSQKLKPP